MNFINEKKDNVLKKLVDSILICDRNCAGWESSYTQYNSNGLDIIFWVGPVDRGSRIDQGGEDDGWMSDDQIDDLAEEYYKKNESKIHKLQNILEEEFSEYKINLLDPRIDYGEKGHIMIKVALTVKGRFFDWKGEKLWADYSGAYEKEKIMLLTPDVERYFESEDEIALFLNTFDYEKESF